VHAALCVLPPPGVASAIDVCRNLHDDNVQRWPPHINLAFPFVADDALDDTVTALAAQLRVESPFSIRLGKTLIFGKAHRGATIEHVHGSTTVESLIAAASPDTPRTPHLTLTTDGSRETPGIVGLQFDVADVAVLRREKDTPFRIHERLQLGRCTLQQAVERTRLCDMQVFELSAPTKKTLETLPGVCRVVGSSALGVRFIDSDIDVAWSPSCETPVAVALLLLGGTHIAAQSGDRIKTRIDGVEVDVMIGGDDAARAVDAPLTLAQTDALRALRVWARVRSLQVSSFAWLALVRECDDERADAIVLAVWLRLQNVRDVNAVSGVGFRGVTPVELRHVRAEASRGLRFCPGVDGASWWTVLAV
jgi:2'-5' RNA ligase